MKDECHLPLTNNLLDIQNFKIEKLNISNRTKKAIMRNGFFNFDIEPNKLTIIDVLTRQNHFLNARGVGRKSWQELKNAVLEKFNKELFIL